MFEYNPPNILQVFGDNAEICKMVYAALKPNSHYSVFAKPTLYNMRYTLRYQVFNCGRCLATRHIYYYDTHDANCIWK